MPFKPLAPELVPLVHHIELAKAGWNLRLAQQLIIAAAYSSNQAISNTDLRNLIERQYGVRVSDGDVQRAVGTLSSKKFLLEVEPGRYRVSEAHRVALTQQIAETTELEQTAKSAFEQILAKYGIDSVDAWDNFHHRCLSPLISEIGARIYHVLSGEPPTKEHQRHVDSYVAQYPPQQRGAIASAVDEFIRSGPGAHAASSFKFFTLISS